MFRWFQTPRRRSRGLREWDAAIEQISTLAADQAPQDRVGGTNAASQVSGQGGNGDESTLGDAAFVRGLVLDVIRDREEAARCQRTTRGAIRGER